jgi:hypothetical protein
MIDMRLLLLFCTGLLLGCAAKPKGPFISDQLLRAPDYSSDAYWAAKPDMEDPADLTPNALEDQQDEAIVDVFFLHPTIYNGKKGGKQWNGPVDDNRLNKRVDESTIQYQASLFNGVGRVYAPRYRQAHIHSYSANDTAAARQAFELAYSDVKAAFEYYLEHLNEGRPIIIASHSQGTTHGKRLVKEFFDNKRLKNRLVVAYLVGIAVLKDEFETIPPCETPWQTGCFCSWRTFKKGKEPKKYVSPTVAVTNPISWTTADTLASIDQHKGAVLFDFKTIRERICDAQIVPELGVLWTRRPKFFSSIFLLDGNYHRGDYNLYYLDVRKNARERVKAFWK